MKFYHFLAVFYRIQAGIDKSNNIQAGIDNTIQHSGWSAFHALESGYRTVIVEDASRGIFSQVSLPSRTNVVIIH